jgi:hypothetical protein
MEKRKMFLLGAGAALDWHNAPTTFEITETIRQSGFKNANDEYVTDKIYQWLSENGKDPNFETILSVIEDFDETTTEGGFFNLITMGISEFYVVDCKIKLYK